MSVNILADFKENGIDKNEPHIVLFTDNELLAGQIVKEKLEQQGCKVESLIVVEGQWTVEQLHDMANYGKDIHKVKSHLLYVSPEMAAYLDKLKDNPEEVERLKRDVQNRMSMARNQDLLPVNQNIGC